MQVNRRIDIKPGDLRCPSCFALDVVPSLPRGLADLVMRRLHRVPRHCRVCGRRFYAREAMLTSRADHREASSANS